MKHWQPEDSAIPLRRDEAPHSEVRELRRATRPDLRGPLPEGAKAGLVLLGAACLLVGFGLYQAFGPLQPVASGAKSSGRN